jgi:hypothetical protein
LSDWKDWKRNDIVFGLILPLVIAFLIIIFPTELRSVLNSVDSSGGLTAILVDGLGEALLTVAVPLFLGLLWNQWAGGAAGFLTGSVYALYVNDTYAATGAWGNNMMIGDVGTLGYMITAMLVGYMAGALNRGSFSFKRMVVSALIAGIISALLLVWTQFPPSLGGLSSVSMTTDPVYGLFITLLPRIIYGIIVPIFATVFGWYGFSPRRMA